MACALTSVLGVVAWQLVWQGSILFAKNTAVNPAHQEARVAVMRIEREIHTCVSVPQLVSTTRQPITSGDAAGISLHQFAAGPFQVAAGTWAAGYNVIDIIAPATTPIAVNQRFNIPSHRLESFITGVAARSGGFRLTLENNLPNRIATTMEGVAVNIPCFTTNLISYIVQNGELRHYPGRSATNFRVLSTGITSPSPFSVPKTAAGADYNRFVAAINLSCADTRTSNRSFRAANMFLNSMVPYRSRLTETQ